jgi:hypothetical protein
LGRAGLRGYLLTNKMLAYFYPRALAKGHRDLRKDRIIYYKRRGS